MRFENTTVHNFSNALRGMRNPKNSWHLGDSTEYIWKYAKNDPNFKPEEHQICEYINGNAKCISIGPNDLKLARTLIRAGSEHRKFLRQIFVSVDITAPLFYWKEFDTYKIGTTANSTSTMHKLMEFPITLNSFEIDDYDENVAIEYSDNTKHFSQKWYIGDFAETTIKHLEDMRQTYHKLQKRAENANNSTDKEYYMNMAYKVWKELIRWLPEGWLQKRTVTITYENLVAMCSKRQRRFHKLNEWSGKYNKEIQNFISWARTLPYAQELIFFDELETTKEKIKKFFSSIGIKTLKRKKEEILEDFSTLYLKEEENE